MISKWIFSCLHQKHFLINLPLLCDKLLIINISHTTISVSFILYSMSIEDKGERRCHHNCTWLTRYKPLTYNYVYVTETIIAERKYITYIITTSSINFTGICVNYLIKRLADLMPKWLTKVTNDRLTYIY